MIIQSPEILSKIAHWRAKQAAGEMTLEDYKEACAVLRANRAGASSVAAASKARARAPVNVESLKDSLKAFSKKT